jgi:hypothetical protein
MDAEPKTYHIETVADFLKVPQDRLDDCLAEFRTVLRCVEPFEALTGAEIVPSFTWVDDGNRHISVDIRPLRPPAEALTMPPYEYQMQHIGTARAYSAPSKPYPDRTDLFDKARALGPPSEDDLRAQRESWVRGEMGLDRKHDQEP